MLIDNVKSPEDIKGFSKEQLEKLAEEIRKGLMNRLSKKGGHFGPNFGFVEATIALHYVFNSPVDKFVFDVSHQSYVHKMLTGRKDAYFYDEHFADVSGYTNPEESEHDFFNVGHTSTSISLACGLAKGRDLKGDKENIVANKIFAGLVDGRISKQLKEICLLDQTYVKAEDGKQTVKAYLASVNPAIKLTKIVRYEVGEGMEKKNEDFAAEVAAQMGM